MIILILGIFKLAQANSCGDSDNQFEGGTAVQCKTNANVDVCVKTGYHSTNKFDGVYIFNIDEESTPVIETMIFDRPKWGRCAVRNFLKSCQHQTLSLTETSISAYHYRAPDISDARSSKVELDLDLESGSGKFKIISYNTKGEMDTNRTITLHSCE